MTNFASIFIQTKCHQKRKTGEKECGNERNICTTTSNWGRHSEERQKIIRIQTETDIIKANAIPSINNELLAKEIVNQQKDCCEKKTLLSYYYNWKKCNSLICRFIHTWTVCNGPQTSFKCTNMSFQSSQSNRNVAGSFNSSNPDKNPIITVSFCTDDFNLLVNGFTFWYRLAVLSPPNYHKSTCEYSKVTVEYIQSGISRQRIAFTLFWNFEFSSTCFT